MLITKIEKQKKDKRRYNIYVDDEFFCGLYDDTVLKYGIRKSDEISDDELSKIKDFDEFIYGKKIAYDYLSYRIRTVHELKKKLKQKKISAASADKIIIHLGNLGLTNDEEFAKQLVKEKIARKPIGRKLLRQKLFEKGVPKEIGDNVLEKTFSEISEKDLASENLKKFLPKLKGKDEKKQKKMIFDYLARRGFDFGVINEIIYENFK